MKGINWLLLIMVFVLGACEDVIHPVLPKTDPVVVIDAWINDKTEEQKIFVNRTLSYFDASPFPGISGANVYISGNDGSMYQFNESDSAGEYVWNPNSSRPYFGDSGVVYQLSVVIGEDSYYSTARLKGVPSIDSISYQFSESNQFMPATYTAQFYATDLPGFGDTYWIKAFKNGKFLAKPSEINIAFDAGFSAGSVVDGIQFIQPIRQGINPFDEDDNGNMLPFYSVGDSVFVEIHSISYEAFNFLTEVGIQTNRPGGFGELFAQPLSNVPTNIISINPEKPAIGFFNVASVSGLGRKLNLPHDKK